jgi:hypothetical protein
MLAEGHAILGMWNHPTDPPEEAASFYLTVRADADGVTIAYLWYLEYCGDDIEPVAWTDGLSLLNLTALRDIVQRACDTWIKTPGDLYSDAPEEQS